MRVAIVGSGYVGLVTGACLAEVGHDVTCIDSDSAKIARLKNGISPIYEPGLDAFLQRNGRHERLGFTTDLAAAISGRDVVFIAVGTPEGEDGSSDLAAVRAVATAIGRKMDGDLLVVVKSTVPVGTSDLVEKLISDEIAQRGVSFRLRVASNPEFLKEGTAIDDFMKPDRIVVGTKDPEVIDVFLDMYRPFILDDPGKLLFMDRRSSELTKYGANAMLATRISFMNEFARLCESLEADIDSVRLGIGADPRIGKKFLFAGPGYGGSCFPKDVEALLNMGRSSNAELSILTAVSHANRAQKLYAAQKIRRYFGDMHGKRIAVWGLAFKPGTDDVRESPALTIVGALLDWGAQVVCHDPKAQTTFQAAIAKHPNLSYGEETYATLQNADAVVLITEWSEFKRPNWDKVARLMKAKVVFDLRNQFSFKTLRDLGFHYECVGRPDANYASRG